MKILIFYIALMLTAFSGYTASGAVLLPDESILKTRFRSAQISSPLQSIALEARIAGQHIAPEKVVTAILYAYEELMRQNKRLTSHARSKLSKEVPALIRTILADHPEAIEVLARSGYPALDPSLAAYSSDDED